MNSSLLFRYIPSSLRLTLIFIVIGFLLTLLGCSSTEKDVVDLVTKADALVQSGAIDKAVKAYQKALKILPDIEKLGPDALKRLISSLIEAQLPAETKAELLDKAIALSIDDKILKRASLIGIVHAAGETQLPEKIKNSLFHKAIEAARIDDRDYVLAAVLGQSLLPRLKKYTANGDLKKAIQQPYIVGKLIPIIEKENEIDVDIFVGLPKEIRAERFQDIGTIIMTGKRFRAVGTFNNGSIAYRTIRDVKIIDKTTSSIIDVKAFLGDRPLSVFATAGGTMGQDPYRKVIAFLKGLPRKELPEM